MKIGNLHVAYTYSKWSGRLKQKKHTKNYQNVLYVYSVVHTVSIEVFSRQLYNYNIQYDFRV